ncbi:MAG: (d)CMP kinase, partial [Clostridia bacterium]|nr:(d)CMP kinase [Clostridia bacterium]
DCVMDGQVCAIEIMPNADVKFFLTANENVRAERRYAELKTKFPNLKLKDVLKELQERYDRDTTRADNPLKPTDESIIVDNTDMNLEETIEYCYNIITKVLNKEHVINVTIDGYVCSGKSTIAKMLAKRIGFKVFDTGAVYRGIACAYDAMGCDDEMRDDEKYVKKFADQIEIKIDFIDGLQHVYVNGIDHTANLRTEHISFLSSQLARYQFIREKVLKLQRSYASNNNLVMEGRDIGSFVLPNAEFKFFCTADDNVRAQRRYDQQKLMGNDVSFDEILKELKARDYSDIHRDHGAIKVTPTSIILDTTNLTLDESVDFCIKEISKKYPEFKNC